MPTINFPSSPVNGQSYSFGGKTWNYNGTGWALATAGSPLSPTVVIPIACSDETSQLTTGTSKVSFRMPFGFVLSSVKASVTVAPTGSVLTVDVNNNGTSILSTKLTIDATERTSVTAATAAVLSSTALVDDDEITIDIDSVGSTVAGIGLKVYLIGQAKSLGQREVLTADRTYYVATTGSDSNNGLSVSSPFLTAQKAVNVAASLDLSIYNVTIQVADGTYTNVVAVSAPWTGAGNVTIKGNTTTPANVLFSVTGNDVIYAEKGARLVVQDLKLVATGNFSLRSSTKAHIDFSNIDFGSCGSQQIRADDCGTITCLGNYSITGSAAIHVGVVSNAVVRIQNKTITITGTPAFSSAFANATLSASCLINANTFSGSATGIRYAFVGNSVCNAGGVTTYLPGDVAGITSTGGQYI